MPGPPGPAPVLRGGRAPGSALGERRRQRGGPFDNAEDFARNDVIGAARSRDLYRGTAVWIDVGTEDPFRVADTRLAEEGLDAVPAQHDDPAVSLPG